MSKTVLTIREKIDGLDNRIHDLLMERAALVLKIGEEKRKNNIQVVQPDREIVMVRRLLERHEGPLPREAVVRIWRELVGAVSLLQTGLKVIVTVPDEPHSLDYWDMAKDYFSSVLPMQKASNPLSALAAVREGEATFGVVPWPADCENAPWWSYLFDESGGEIMRIIARLPLGNRSAEEPAPEIRALVIARLKFEPSGDDRSFIGFDLDTNISRARIVDKAKALDLEPLSLHTSPGRIEGRKWHLLEVSCYVKPEEKIVGKLLESLEDHEGRIVVLGGYPTPPVYNDKVGKSAAVNVTYPEKESGEKKKSA